MSRNLALKPIVFFCALVTVALFGLWPVVQGQAASLGLNDQGGAKGSIVTYTVSLAGAPNEVKALGFDLRYDPRILSYRGYTSGGLVQGFDFFDANSPSPGSVRVGGFVAGTSPIGPGEAGTLVSVSFEIVGHEDSQVSLSSLKDDIKSWSARSGDFTGDHEVESNESSDDEVASSHGSSLFNMEESTHYNPESSSSETFQSSFDRSSYDSDHSQPISEHEHYRATTSAANLPHGKNQSTVGERKTGRSHQKTGAASVSGKQSLSGIPKIQEHRITEAVSKQGTVGGRQGVKGAAVAETGLHQPSPWGILTGTMTFLLVVYYLTIAGALLLVTYLSWELIQGGRRRLHER